MENSKAIRHHKQSSDSNDTLSSHSILSINLNEPLVNNTAHDLFILAVKQARNERQHAKKQCRQKNGQLPTRLMMMKKTTTTKKLTMTEIDRLFEEKCLRPLTMKQDLFNLYQQSTSRIRSMLDLHQIDQFIETTQNRKII